MVYCFIFAVFCFTCTKTQPRAGVGNVFGKWGETLGSSKAQTERENGLNEKMDTELKCSSLGDERENKDNNLLNY